MQYSHIVTIFSCYGNNKKDKAKTAPEGRRFFYNNFKNHHTPVLIGVLIPYPASVYPEVKAEGQIHHSLYVRIVHIGVGKGFVPGS